jgi:hypothetical protein
LADELTDDMGQIDGVVTELMGRARLVASRILAAGALCALLTLFWPAPQPAGAQGSQQVAVSPLPASDYSVRPVCAPPAPGHASCLALELVAQTPAARAHSHPLGMTRSVPIRAGAAAEVCRPPIAAEGCWGLRPQDLHSAYGLPTRAPSQQTIALVDAYDDPTAEKDLKVYDNEFELPACTHANGCFTKINQQGERKPLPEANDEAAVEISLDIEIAHATCQNCHIMLVEAESLEYKNLEAAENRAVLEGATEISNSWYGDEPLTDSAAFDHPGIVITAAAGDYGYLNWGFSGEAAPEEIERGAVNYPASSPHVVAVGGTRLELDSPANTWERETVWNGYGATGSGCSARFAAPPWQLELPDWPIVGCGSSRAVADIAADADPYTGVAVYDSTPDAEGQVLYWRTVGGTSLASPLIAATFALAGGARGVEYPARTLYEGEARLPASLHDVESGSDGECTKRVTPEGLSGCTVPEEAASCSGQAICVAGPGYDGPSGVGTPDGIGAFEPRTTQTVTFTSPAPSSATVEGPVYAVVASASSGLVVSLSSATPAVCSVVGSTVSFTGVGTCTIEGDQVGDPEYYPAQAQQSFAVGKKAQLIEFTSLAPGSATVDGPAYPVAATAPSGLVVSFSSATPAVCSVTYATVSFTGVGTCTIDANQAGNSRYEAAPQAQQSFPVASAPVSSTLSFTSSFTPILTPTPESAFSLTVEPSINRRTGAITFTASVPDPGALSWLLTFENGRFGAFQSGGRCATGQIRLDGSCRPARIVFGRGDVVVAIAGTVSFTVKPSASAEKALGKALEKGRGLSVTATLTFRSSLGGSPVRHTRSVTDRLQKPDRKGRG